ncbi:MAG: site-specific integrase [Ruminococcaceae bacterium]|nr:site-specific integrase [Oscillospiraceae bacterium]
MSKRKLGDGTLRLRKDGRWEGRIVIDYDKDGLPITKNVTSKSKAICLEKLDKLKDELGINRKENTITFGEWLDFWYQNYCKLRIKPKTQEDYENRIYLHIIPNLGNIPLKKLTQTDLQKFYNKLKTSGRLQHTDIFGKGLSARVIRGCHSTCRTALQTAVEQGIIRKNPAIGCKLPPKKSREIQVLTRDEIQRFLIQAKYDGYFEILLVVLTTGLRRGEETGLMWSDLNTKTGELKICRQVQRINGKLVVTELKTDESERSVILPKSVVKALVKYKETVDSEWIFPSPKNKDMPRDPSAVYKMMQKILKRSGCKTVSFHALRHTFATNAVANGMDIKTLSAIIGHVSSKTTMDIYLHTTEEMKQQAAAKINARFSKNVDTTKEVTPTGQEKPAQAKFEPTKGKYRKPGTGCITKINDHLYEGRYSPKGADGKRILKNVYAKTETECEEKLAELIKEMKAEIAAEKAKAKPQNNA